MGHTKITKIRHGTLWNAIKSHGVPKNDMYSHNSKIHHKKNK